MPGKRLQRRYTILKTRPLLLALLLIIAAASMLGYVLVGGRSTPPQSSQNHNVAPENTINYSPAPSADNKSNDARKGSTSPSSTLEGGSSAPTSSTSFSVQIVSANNSNGNVHVGTLVNGIASGDCSLTAIKAGYSTLQLANSSVVQDINNYDCGVFNIPTSKFPAHGTWKLTLTVTNNGTSATGTFEVTI